MRGDVTVIFIESKKYGIIEVLIDTEDLSKVFLENTSWFASYDKALDGFYIRTLKTENFKRTRKRIHRVIMGNPKGLVIDHRDGNTLDNRKNNLRSVPQSVNVKNKKKNRHNTSGFRNVSFNKTVNKWVAYINIDGKRTHLGSFSNIEDAAEEARKAREKHYGIESNFIR